MNIDDYEHLPSTSVATNMTAGAIAGILEHCIMYPLDSVKTRMQSISPSTSGFSVYQTLSNMMKEGFMRPIRGMGAVVLGAGPAHAFYFGAYEYTKETLSKFSKSNQIHYVVAATTATLVHDAISIPTEVIKQRLQMYNSPYRSVMHCAKVIYKNEGVRAFYRSYYTQLVMNLPYQALHFCTYEFFQNTLNKDHKYNPPIHMVAGAAAGAAAAAFTTPLDVIKTLLNTQEKGFGSSNMREAISQIYKATGSIGFLKGLTPRVMYSMPATAICWSTYEFFKFVITQNNSNDTCEDESSVLYTFPTSIVSNEQATNSLNSHSHLSQTTNYREPPITNLPMSGVNVYNAFNLNTRHLNSSSNRRDI